jgi:hypothetical protein
MTINPNIVKFITIIVIILAFAGIIYTVATVFATKCPGQRYDPDQKKCITVCDTDKINDPKTGECKTNCNGKVLDDDHEIINNKCVSKCKNNLIRCGFECIDNVIRVCDKQNGVCNANQLCSPDGICCKPTEHCVTDNVTGLTKCGECPNIICNGECCLDDTYVCTANKCCKKDNVSKDKNGIDVCCEQSPCIDSSGNKLCCDTGAGEICKNGKCIIGCPNPAEMGLYTCNGASIPYPTNVNIACDPAQELCLHNCDTNQFSCVSKNDCWKNTTYTPPLLNNGSNNILLGNLSVNVCSDSIDGSGNLWIKNPGKNLYNTIKVESNLGSTQNCGQQSCLDKISQDSSTIVNFQPPSKVDVTSNPGLCESSISCSQNLLNQTQVNTVCNTLDKNVEEYGRCCKDTSGNYTGQICKPGESCINGVCHNKSTYCGVGGTFDYMNKICNCETNFAGNQCQYTRSVTCEGKGTPRADGKCDPDYEDAVRTTTWGCDSGTPPNTDSFCPTSDDSSRPYKYFEKDIYNSNGNGYCFGDVGTYTGLWGLCHRKAKCTNCIY